jgi:hypothetical protein
MPGDPARRIRDLQGAVRRLEPELLHTHIPRAVHEVQDSDDDETDQDDPEEETDADRVGEG